MHLINFFAFTLLLSLGACHSFLTDPDAYNRVFQLSQCKGKECNQACPTIPDNPANTPEKPARVWRRGKTVTIRWAKNNHIGGFVRFALVPVPQMMNRKTHELLSLYDGCWAQGLYNCKGDLCGSDQSGNGFRRDLKIPTVFPDGDYVFGMVWYGGVKTGRPVFFSDYWSCSFVRIQGGPMGGKYKPFFEIGKVIRDGDRENNKCFTAIDAPGVCPNSGCKPKPPPDYKIPRRYRSGKGPKAYGAKQVRKAFN